jgi:hypothetical protein
MAQAAFGSTMNRVPEKPSPAATVIPFLDLLPISSTQSPADSEAEVLPGCPLKASQARMIAALAALTPYPVGPAMVAVPHDYEQRALYVGQCAAAFFAHMRDIALDIADNSRSMSKKVVRTTCESYSHDFASELAGYMRAVADEQAVDEGW